MYIRVGSDFSNLRCSVLRAKNFSKNASLPKLG